MNLHFSLVINGKPNFFAAKIWRSLALVNDLNEKELSFFHNRLSAEEQAEINLVKPKLHTIRTDQGNLWKPGMEIQPIMSNDSSAEVQFAPTLKCLNVQRFDITYLNDFTALLRVDDRLLSSKEIEALALNDGFDQVADFYNYFNYSFKGKLIHWTDLKY